MKFLSFTTAITSLPIAIATIAAGSLPADSARGRELTSLDPARIVIASYLKNDYEYLFTYNGVDSATGLPEFNSTILPVGIKQTSSVVFGDINNDNHPDLILATVCEGHFCDIRILINDGANGFEGDLITVANTKNYVTAHVVDIDKDGYGDLIMGTNQAGTWLHRNNAGSFDSDPVRIGNNVNVAGSVWKGFAVADINNDTWPDLVLQNCCWPAKILYNDGAGNYPSAVDIEAPNDPIKSSAAVQVGDVDNDGDLDIVLITAHKHKPDEGQNWPNRLFLNDGDGNFAPQDLSTEPYTTEDVLLEDVNNDGWLDIIVGYYERAEHQLLLNDGGGGFPSSALVPGMRNTGLLASADVNGDGNIDVLECNGNRGYVSIGDGVGNFTEPHLIKFIWGCSGGIAVLAPATGATSAPTLSPSQRPTSNPTSSPTGNPTFVPTLAPSGSPTMSPKTSNPTSSSPTTAGPTASTSPTAGPTTSPATAGPTASTIPTAGPTTSPTTAGPTASTSPTAGPTTSPTTAGPTSSTSLTAGPTAAPVTAGPSAAPSAGPTACGDDPGWLREVNPKHSCGTVANNPAKFCKWMGEKGIRAFHACRKACDSCGCRDDPYWRREGNPKHGCHTVAGRDTANRCEWMGENGIRASVACKKTCGSCGPTTPDPTPAPSTAGTTPCVDDPDWRKNNKPNYSCRNVGIKDTEVRCEKWKNEKGVPASVACKKTCDSCGTAGPTAAPTACDAEATVKVVLLTGVDKGIITDEEADLLLGLLGSE